jgi:glycine cleavage system H protein
MSEIRPELQYTKDHEWVKKSNAAKIVVIGITDFAQSALGDVTFLQLPAIGQSFNRGDILGTVESVKAVSDIYAPLSGKIVKLNDNLVQDPAPLNTSPFDQAWLVELEVSNEAEFKDLLTAGAYASIAQ